MKLLVACEHSGVVRDAFKAIGWDATSCDLEPTDVPGKHYQGRVDDILYQSWDLLIAHPPCDHLAISGAGWFKTKPPALQDNALAFVRLLWDSGIPRIAIENPVGVLSTRFRKPDQIIQPYQFGHSVPKRTCLWLKNLPPYHAHGLPPHEQGNLLS